MNKNKIIFQALVQRGALLRAKCLHLIDNWLLITNPISFDYIFLCIVLSRCGEAGLPAFEFINSRK